MPTPNEIQAATGATRLADLTTSNSTGAAGQKARLIHCEPCGACTTCTNGSATAARHRATICSNSASGSAAAAMPASASAHAAAVRIVFMGEGLQVSAR